MNAGQVPGGVRVATATVRSVNVGAARTVMLRDRPVRTAIWKSPVEGRVRLRGVNLDGDDQADRSVHGGPDKAVYAYASEDLAWWATELGRAVEPGTFGENLTTAGIDLAGAVIGERWAVGSAVLEVAQPRIPCYKIGIQMGDPQFPRRFAEAARPGTYLRIVSPGDLAAGDPIRILARPEHGVTIGLVERAYHADRSLVMRLFDAAELPESWADWARRAQRPDGLSLAPCPTPPLARGSTGPLPCVLPDRSACRRTGRRWTGAATTCDTSHMASDAASPAAGVALQGDLDEESRLWLDRLQSQGPDRTEAVQALFDLLHRGARHEAHRRRGSLPGTVVDELDDLALQAADDALAAILRKLADYRGASRFTTWAYKFAIFEVSAALRREAWRGRAITIDDAAWGRLADPAPVDPQAETEVRELLAAIERSVASDLTARQREVFMAVVILEVPVDVVAERHGSTRGAVYKVLHDARRKLRTALDAQGWHSDESGGAS